MRCCKEHTAKVGTAVGNENTTHIARKQEFNNVMNECLMALQQLWCYTMPNMVIKNTLNQQHSTGNCTQ